MGRKKSKKSPKKNELDAESFACDILTFILSFCGFPKEKMKYEQGKRNSYRDNKYVSTVGAIVASVSLFYRDEWKTMFESRLKISGFDTIEKIENCLTQLLAINREYKKGNVSAQVHLSLAAYSEIIQFLNHKEIEFDFGQLLNSWSRYFMQHIAQCRNAGDEILQNLFVPISDTTESANWIITFMQNVASPYGSRDDVSIIYRERSRARLKVDHEENVRLAEFLDQAINAEELAPSLPADFESPTVLPGDRESPEPPLNPECGAVGGKEVSKRGRTRSAGVVGYRSGKSSTVLASSSKPSTSLSDDRELPKTPLTHERGVVGSRKILKSERNLPASVAEYKSGEVLTSSPGDREPPEPLLNPEWGAVGGKEVSKRGRTRSAGVVGYASGKQSTVSASGSKTFTSLSDDRESPKPPLSHERGVVGSRKVLRSERNLPASVAEYKSGEVLTSSPGDREPPEQQLCLERGVVEGRNVSRRRRTQSTSVSEYRPGERQGGKTCLEQEIEERLRQMNLDSLQENRDAESNQRKPMN